MFAAILRSQWRAARLVLLILALVIVWLPFWMLRSPAFGNGAYDIVWLIQRATLFGATFQITALVVGLILAVACWQPDRATKHVYALALPISRQRYLLLRMGAGLALHLPIAITLGIAGFIATRQAPLPAVVHAYPVALAIRWLLGAWSVFGMFFLLLSLGNRVSRFIAVSIITVVAVDLMLVALGITDSPWIIDQIVQGLQHVFGPAGSFLERWMLVDV